ncbi:hypothetical protein [Herbiconiux sp. VKM Ac-2851]|uniref:hypothetical protein n=1 Tax=Herbiconiux sp. VKM Ac-2851 TaxID=2739025 RepID=UPI001C203133|nr:hypothetical protein [Herbiconiux sp. VKM Ac-2851]
MTASPTAAPVLAPVAPALTWTSPETKLWVATLSDEFAGYVEFTAGHFAVTDATGHPRPPHATLRAAQSSLTPTPADPNAPTTISTTDAVADADAAATAFAVATHVPAASGHLSDLSPLLTPALAATAIALAGAALGTLAVALNVLAL